MDGAKYTSEQRWRKPHRMDSDFNGVSLNRTLWLYGGWGQMHSLIEGRCSLWLRPDALSG